MARTTLQEVKSKLSYTNLSLQRNERTTFALSSGKKPKAKQLRLPWKPCFHRPSAACIALEYSSRHKLLSA